MKETEINKTKMPVEGDDGPCNNTVECRLDILRTTNRISARLDVSLKTIP